MYCLVQWFAFNIVSLHKIRSLLQGYYLITSL